MSKITKTYSHIWNPQSPFLLIIYFLVFTVLCLLIAKVEVARGSGDSLQNFGDGAKHKDPQAQAFLGSQYYFGTRGKTDFNKARDYFRLAASQGNASGQVGLGVVYRRGLVGKPNYKEALRLFELAAEQGDPQAKFELGVLYHHGWGVPKDEQKAGRWFDRAAKEGNPEALVLLGDKDSNIMEKRELCLTAEERISRRAEFTDYYEDLKVINCLFHNNGCEGGEKDAVGFRWHDTFFISMCQRYLELVDLDGNDQQDVVLRKETGGVSNRPFTLEILLNGKLIENINPNKFGIQSRFKIVDRDGDGKKEIITWSGLWDPRMPGEEGVTKETYEGHSSPHRYVFVTYKLIRGEYYPWHYYTTKKKYPPYFSWEGEEFPE